MFYDIMSESGEACPDDYIKSIGTLVIVALKKIGWTERIKVSVNLKRSLVRISGRRPIGGFYQQETDCQLAFDAKHDPEIVARTAVENFVQGVEMAKNGK